MDVIESPSTDPALNLALEQVVFDRLPRDREYCMLWQNDNAVIVGRNQNTAEEINAEEIRRRGVRVVRRLSGGGAVYHDLGNINFTFVVDAGEAAGIDLRVFCLPVVAALQSLGVTAEISGRNDMTVEGKKFSGNAQYRKNGRVMHHGTIMFDCDLDVVGKVLQPQGEKLSSKGVASVRSRVTNLRPWLPEGLTLKEFWQVLRKYLGQNGPDYHLTEADMAAARQLRETRYATWDWNYGVSPGYRTQKSRRFEGCGTVKLYLDTKKGRITGLESRGDYFGDENIEDLRRALTDCPLEEASLRTALAGVDVDRFYHGLTAEDLISLLLL